MKAHKVGFAAFYFFFPPAVLFAQGDYGRARDAGDSVRNSIHVSPRKDPRLREGKLVTLEGQLGGGDLVDTYRLSPYFSKNTFLSLLVTTRQTDAVYSVSVKDRKSDPSLCGREEPIWEKCSELHRRRSNFCSISDPAGVQ